MSPHHWCEQNELYHEITMAVFLGRNRQTRDALWWCRSCKSFDEGVEQIDDGRLTANRFPFQLPAHLLAHMHPHKFAQLIGICRIHYRVARPKIIAAAANAYWLSIGTAFEFPVATKQTTERA